MLQFTGGETVLVRGLLSIDGRTVSFGPGVEVRSASLDIVTDVPRFDQGEEASALLLFFSSEAERQQFADDFSDVPEIVPRAF